MIIKKMHSIDIYIDWDATDRPALFISAKVDIEVLNTEMTIPVHWAGDGFIVDTEEIELLDEIRETIESYLIKINNRNHITDAIDKIADGSIVRIDEVVFNEEIEEC